MDEFLRDHEPSRTIKSLSLKEIVNARPPLFRGMIEAAKSGLMIWGAISLSAAAGYAALHLQGGPAEPVLQGETQAAAPAQDAAEAEASVVPVEAAGVVEAAPDEAAQAVTELAARLPRPRPDEPVITGSIARAGQDHAAAYTHYRRADPCEAWNSLGMPLRFRCVRETRVEPRYYPAYPQRW